MKQPTTQGLTFIKHSLAAFNGSGYADYANPKAYMSSFRDYLAYKQRRQHSELLERHYDELYALAAHIIATGQRTGHTPSPKSLDRFKAFRSGDDQPDTPQTISLF